MKGGGKYKLPKGQLTMKMMMSRMSRKRCEDENQGTAGDNNIPGFVRNDEVEKIKDDTGDKMMNDGTGDNNIPCLDDKGDKNIPSRLYEKNERIVKEKEDACTSGLAPVLPGQRPCPVKPRRGILRDKDKNILVVVVDNENENDDCDVSGRKEEQCMTPKRKFREIDGANSEDSEQYSPFKFNCFDKGRFATK